MIKEFVFEACNAEGQVEKDIVVATDVADARLQLSRMGYSDIRDVTENLLANRALGAVHLRSAD